MIRIKALFPRGQCGLCVWCVEKGDRGRRRKEIKDFWEMENFHLECGGEEWEKKMYFV